LSHEGNSRGRLFPLGICLAPKALFHVSLGRCPRLALNAAPLALNIYFATPFGPLRAGFTRQALPRIRRASVRSVAPPRPMEQMKRIFLLALALSLSFSAAAKAQLPVKNVLTLQAAKKIAAAAEAEAKKRGATVVIVVVDDGGHLLLLERLDDTQVASVEVGIGKART